MWCSHVSDMGTPSLPLGSPAAGPVLLSQVLVEKLPVHSIAPVATKFSPVSQMLFLVAVIFLILVCLLPGEENIRCYVQTSLSK